MRFKPAIPISIQISLFLVIVAFIPVAVMMMLRTYENQLLSLTESSNVQQARILAASLSCMGSGGVSGEDARAVLRRMDGRFDARIRILDSTGLLLADSSAMEQEPSAQPQAEPKSAAAEPPVTAARSAENSFVYRLFSLPVRVYRKLFRPPAAYASADFYTGKKVYTGSEIQAARSGKYGAATRISSGGQVSVTLYSAVPVMHGDTVAGIILVSRSTYRILQNLYELRTDLGRVFLWSLAAVGIIAVFLTARVSLPLKKLARQTAGCADKNGRILFTGFAGQKRRDEIGALSRSFSTLIEKLNARIRYTEAFSADVSHEFKNPLAAIRSSAELLSHGSMSTQERARFTEAILEEVTRLERLLSGVRRISRIDGTDASDGAAAFCAVDFARNIAAAVMGTYPGVAVSVALAPDAGAPEPSGDITVRMNPDYFERLIGNLVDNAAGFARRVSVTFGVRHDAAGGRLLTVCVEDDGPGIAEQDTERIFSRFYSCRPGADAGKVPHTGLGLSIVKAIAEASGGTVCAGRSERLGGALFCAELPILPPSSSAVL